MLLGYNTNGLAHHDPLAALELLGEIGYRSVALTLDHGRLDPFAPSFAGELATVRSLLSRLGLVSVVETGARFLLDPRHKHEPTLVSADPAARRRRVDFLCRAVDAAAHLGSGCVSLWSGQVHDGAGDDAAWDRLLAGLNAVLEHAQRRGMCLGFEPEPGMFIDTMSRFAELQARLAAPQLKLTLDVGHLHCQGELPLTDTIRQWGAELVNVHLEDMRQGVHEHLMFGDGEIEFPPVIEALAGTGYQGPIHVELSRHSHAGPTAAARAFAFLAPLLAHSATLHRRPPDGNPSIR
jgi:sugar phosphate isomerase/epimerase